MERQGRGAVTPQIKELSKKLLGYEIGVRELRLMPYVQYCLMDSERVSRINEEESEILVKWYDSGFITQGMTDSGRVMIGEKLKVTHEFWTSMNEILYFSYADCLED